MDMVFTCRRGKTVGSGRGRVGSGQSGWRVKWVTGQNGSFLNGSNRVVARVGLTRIFQKKKFQLQKQINDNLFRENE